MHTSLDLIESIQDELTFNTGQGQMKMQHSNWSDYRPIHTGKDRIFVRTLLQNFLNKLLLKVLSQMLTSVFHLEMMLPELLYDLPMDHHMEYLSM